MLDAPLASARKPKPIMFSAPMVRALLEGRKTQTRRVLKDVRSLDDIPSETQEDLELRGWEVLASATGPYMMAKVGFRVGDLLWVREAWRTDLSFDHLSPKRIETACIVAGYKTGWAPIAYEAGGYSSSWGSNGWHELGKRKRASMHLPRWASRITLEVTDVRIEPLQDISEADAQAEGLLKLPATGRWVADQGAQYAGKASLDPRTTYAWLWEDINGDGAWEANPWVVAVSFKVHRMNVDAFLSAKERAA